MPPLLQHLCPKSSVSGAPCTLSCSLRCASAPEPTAKNHIHRIVTFISKNRNSTGKWEMWMRSPELMSRYDGISFLRCLTHTTTYCVTVLKQESLSSLSQRPEVTTRVGCACGRRFGALPRPCPFHTCFLGVWIQMPLLSLVSTQDRPPRPSNTTSS